MAAAGAKALTTSATVTSAISTTTSMQGGSSNTGRRHVRHCSRGIWIPDAGKHLPLLLL
jgi:hypothetical protein